MKQFVCRYAVLFWISALGMLISAGCQSRQPEGGANAAMSEKQKAIIKEHKQQQDE